MKLDKFTSGGILGIIFRHIKESPRTLAELYVFRDRSLVYKWLHDSATPSKGLVPGIVAFVMDKSCEPIRISIQKELGDYVSVSGLRPEIVAQLTGTVPFQKFMEDILHFAISQPSDISLIEEPADRRRKPWGGRSISFSELALALLAVLGSGILWNVINRLLGWTYYMGGDGREPRGIAAAVWGLTVVIPIILTVSASMRRSDERVATGSKMRHIVVPVLYSLAGIVGSVVFYNYGVRGYIEGFRLGYSLQELIIGFSFALLVSLLPLGVIVIAGRIADKTGPGGFAVMGYAFLPPLLVTTAVSITLFVARPIAELEQLRGFLAGLMLRTGMFVAARGMLVAISRRP